MSAEFIVGLKPPQTGDPNHNHRKFTRLGSAETLEAAERLTTDHIGKGNRVLIFTRETKPDGGSIERLQKAWLPDGRLFYPTA